MEQVNICVPVNDHAPEFEPNIIAEWLIPEGQYVSAGEMVVILDADKASYEVVAPQAGILLRHLKQVEDKVLPGEVIAILDVTPAVQIPSY